MTLEYNSDNSHKMQGVRLPLAPKGSRGGDCIYSITRAILAAGYSHIGLPWWFGTMEPIWSTIDALFKHIDGKGGHDECHTYKGSIQYSSVQFCMLSLVCMHCLSAYTDLEERRDNGEQ